MRSGQTAREAALAVLRGQWLAWRSRESGTKEGKSTRALHQMRVAVRRMREATKIFPKVLPRKVVALRPDLAWLGRALGEVRDLDVTVGRFARLRKVAPPDVVEGLGLLEASVRKERSRARKKLRKVLEGDRYAQLLATVEKRLWKARGPGKARARKPVDTLGKRLVEDRFRRLQTAGRALHEQSPADDFHEVRIRAKSLRYGLEFLEPLYGEPAQRAIQSTKKLQDVLGEHQDACVQVDRLFEYLAVFGEAPPASVMAAAAWLRDHYNEAILEQRSRFPATFREVETAARWARLERATRSDTRAG